VWAACDDLPRAPFDDRTAIGRSLAKIGKTLKDVERELGEMKEGEKEEGNGKGEGEEEDEEDEDLLDFTGGEDLSAEEMEAVAAARVLLDSCLGLLQGLMRLLLAAPAPMAEGDVAAAERCLDHCTALQRGMEDVTASLYPPIDPGEVTGAIARVLAAARGACSAELGAWAPRAELQGMREAVEEAATGVTAAVRDL
jgi:cyclin-D1-binding protein 1